MTRNQWNYECIMPSPSFVRFEWCETERSNLSSYTYARSNNYTIPTISSPTTDHFSLQRQTTLPSYDDVIRQQKIEEQSESPPPRYDEIV